jgi:hypothetical protein
MKLIFHFLTVAYDDGECQVLFTCLDENVNLL